MTDKFHDKAKDSGNKLKANILSFSSVATGVFFFTLTGKDLSKFTATEKSLLLGAIIFFASTVVLCLVELYVDSQRFFAIARQLEKPVSDQNWTRPKRLKSLRIRMINASYFTVITGFIFTFVYMVLRVA